MIQKLSGEQTDTCRHTDTTGIVTYKNKQTRAQQWKRFEAKRLKHEWFSTSLSMNVLLTLCQQWKIVGSCVQHKELRVILL